MQKSEPNILSIPIRALAFYGKNKSHFFSIKNAEKLSQALIALAIVIIVHWFSGPYAAVATRALYELIFNQYAWYDPRYYLFHVPAREHISYQAFIYGPYAISVILTPLIYKLIRQSVSIGKKLFNCLFGKKNQSTHITAADETHENRLNTLLNDDVSNDLLLPHPSQNVQAPLLHSYAHRTNHHPLPADNDQTEESHEIEITHSPRPLPLI